MKSNKSQPKIIIYGISNCDSIKKTIHFFNQNKIAFEFFDYKKLSITKEKLLQWCSKIDWQILLNKKGTTYKKLPKEDQLKITTQNSALKFMILNTSSIKRPVIEIGNKLIVGFNEEELKILYTNISA